jgi:hypothetical protein
MQIRTLRDTYGEKMVNLCQEEFEAAICGIEMYGPQIAPSGLLIRHSDVNSEGPAKTSASEPVEV